MCGVSSQVIWKQQCNSAVDLALSRALASLQCEMRELPSQQWDAGTASIGGVRDYQCSYLAPAAAEWSSVLLHRNALVGDQLAGALSRLMSTPSIAFSEYDQTTWGYTLFVEGVPLDRFWSVSEIVEEDADAVRGTPAELSRIFGVPESTVAPYLQHLSPDSPDTSKVFSDDEFELNDHWVRVDFMRRLGILYPDPGKTAGGRYLQIIEPHASGTTPQEKTVSPPRKARWKFW